jgi:HTH-like domain
MRSSRKQCRLVVKKNLSRHCHCAEWKVSNENDCRCTRCISIELDRAIQEGLTPLPAKDVRTRDEEVLADIRRLTDERPTYCYPRVTALLRKDLKTAGKPPINHKRVCRIMRENGLSLSRHQGKRTLNHDGQVITLKSNLRWCTDIFHIQCWNGDIV